MLELFKKSELKLYAPVNGMVFDLSSLPDPTFAQRTVGDGTAIDISDDVIKAPCDGILTFVFKTNHAFGITTLEGIEILVHIGINTVELNGKGFERLCEEGTEVKVGQPIIKIDRDFIKSKGFSTDTLVLITNMDIVKSISTNAGASVTAGKDAVVTAKLKYKK